MLIEAEDEEYDADELIEQQMAFDLEGRQMHQMEEVYVSVCPTCLETLVDNSLSKHRLQCHCQYHSISRNSCLLASERAVLVPNLCHIAIA